jgi:hypothetical protein
MTPFPLGYDEQLDMVRATERAPEQIKKSVKKRLRFDAVLGFYVLVLQVSAS